MGCQIGLNCLSDGTPQHVYRIRTLDILSKIKKRLTFSDSLFLVIAATGIKHRFRVMASCLQSAFAFFQLVPALTLNSASLGIGLAPVVEFGSQNEMSGSKDVDSV